MEPKIRLTPWRSDLMVQHLSYKTQEFQIGLFLYSFEVSLKEALKEPCAILHQSPALYHTDPLTPVSLLLKYYPSAQLGILPQISPAVVGASREVKGIPTVHLLCSALLVENKEKRKKNHSLSMCISKVIYREMHWKRMTIKL